MLDHQNNYVRNLNTMSNAEKVSTFQTTLTTNLNVTHNYLNNLITLFSDLHLLKFLLTLWSFFMAVLFV